MRSKFLSILLVMGLTFSSASAIGMSDDSYEEEYEEEYEESEYLEEYSSNEDEGELIDRYTEEYIDIEEAKALGLKLQEVEIEEQEHHDKLQQHKVLPKENIIKKDINSSIKN